MVESGMFIAVRSSGRVSTERKNMKNLLRLSLSVAAVCAVAMSVRAADPDPASYVGLKTCGMCHKKDETGNQLAKWQASPHAKAFETLGSDKAKEVAKAKGIADPQKDGKCLKCHATAYNFGETAIANEKVKVEDGVICESCHGPGANYKSKSTMEDQAKAIAGGLIHPATKSCTKCHNDQSPSFKGFDEAKYAEKIAHPNPAKKK